MSLAISLFRKSIFALGLLGSAALAEAGSTVEVWKSPLCGCCGGWVDHMRAAGFTVVVHDVEDVGPIKVAHGVGDDLASCHTAMIDGHVVEGHVPAQDVRRLLAEGSAGIGLAAPGMPSGAPGMGSDGAPYDVVAFDAGGSRRIFARH
ncbi:MAG: DUF411 domain-containing protein [Hyphomicrobiales bacterium]|nr:DUF411 domain-containing protein [Hyphomicrobiales bacterium]